jgi:hypothetical protein
MRFIQNLNALPKFFLVLAVLYFLTSLGHFSHNAEFICEYPNLPPSFTRAKVYAAWMAVTSVGALGLWLVARHWVVVGLLFMAVYAGLGFDGLAHYSLAPMEWHPLAANVTILSEVAAAALLFPTTLVLLALRLRQRH